MAKINPLSTEGMYIALDGLKAEREALLKTSEKARAAREALVAKIGPLEVELRKANAAIRMAHAPDGPDAETSLYSIDQMIANISKAVSGKPDPRVLRAMAAKEAAERAAAEAAEKPAG